MPPVKYRRIKGRPLTITRDAPDQRLEASRRWKRVDEDTPTPATPPAESKES